MDSDPIVIVSAVRTPIGAMLGALSGLEATDLGAAVIKAAVERAGIAPDQVQEVLMGCEPPAGQGPAGHAEGGASAIHRCHHAQQGMRIRHEGRDAGP